MADDAINKLEKEILLEKAFKGYAKFGVANSNGNQITLSNIDKWLKEAAIVNGKKVSTTDTAILFQRFKAKTIDFRQFLQFIEGLAKESKLNQDDIMNKLAKCAVPGTSRATQADKSNIVQRLTDTSKYTGSHKERFDAKGKGKGKSGREDRAENSGYVQGYKEKNTYDAKKK
ncbi:unnamed protein product [Leptidea sinapis]|uniref:TPPP family protein n=1 Tax=Leptidea sinapis TaxID=189913 RepID=A0A5E4QDP0_9NEOP|nr:unnamed protein product [Leptidea sinapis]